MKRRVLVTPVFIALLTFLVVIISDLKINAQTETGKEPLIVKFAYAPGKIRKGDIWKIYLSVSDTEGNMKEIAFSIDEPGGTRCRPTFIILKKGMQKEFTGYFALHTAASRNLSGVEITLKMIISDDKGNRKELSFPLEFDGQAMKPLPPEMEKELNRRIGIIDIDLDIQS